LSKKRKSFKQDDHNHNEGGIKMAKTEKPLTKDALVSMQVIDSKGHLVGKVKDVAFVVGETGISLSVENESGETQCIPWQEISAAADFILLKPQGQSNPAQSMKKEDSAAGIFVEQAEQTKQTEKAEPKKQSKQPLCPTCNKPLTWIPQYSRWYCYNDKKYVNPEESAKKEDWEEVFAEETTQQPVSKKQSSKPLCPTCNKPLTWIPQYSRWYCYNDKKYV